MIFWIFQMCILLIISTYLCVHCTLLLPMNYDWPTLKIISIYLKNVFSTFFFYLYQPQYFNWADLLNKTKKKIIWTVHLKEIEKKKTPTINKGWILHRGENKRTVHESPKSLQENYQNILAEIQSHMIDMFSHISFVPKIENKY